MHLHLLRHARTSSNAQGKLASRNDERLDEVGREQAQKLIQPLSSLSVSSIWCSPLPRAIETISPFLRSSNLELSLIPELAEGQLNLDPFTEHKSETYLDYELPPDILQDTPGLEPTASVPPDDESVGQFRSRVAKFLSRTTKDPETSVLVVTHGHFIREFLNLFMDCHTYTRFPVSNCSITHIEISDHNYLHYLNRRLI